ncbi:hypothetical protein MRB53_015529 [Persea americana]|uniref:Uncharacterized protein n=1 Tax=Persea americana TaxID=3435 RepID=A0ACC2LZL6_PERAE|nr:hypothetical protein MRB53_015529 [Persea americana]
MATAMIDRPGEDGADASERLKRVVEENPVLVFGQRGCFMCHVVNRLLLGHGVKAVVWEVEEGEESSLVQEIAMMPGDQRLQFPAVFIGGRFVGGIDRLISLHISGDLVPILKEAGALWL